jgi:NTP pyrophosphatase (non-canonical NTP hydrolase)
MEKSTEELIKKIICFNKARGWTPATSDTAKSIIIEASELLEHFQWDESDRNIKGIEPKNWVKVGEEVADVFWYLVTFCNAANINLQKVIEDKLIKNEKKYPVEMFKGKHNDKFYKEQKRKYREQRA